MLPFNRSRLLSSLLLFTYLLPMTTPSKTCWPELVGKTADEAVKVIKEESGFSKVPVCGPKARTTRDVDEERVRVYVDDDNKVTSQPIIG